MMAVTHAVETEVHYISSSRLTGVRPNQLAVWVTVGCGCVCSPADVLALRLVVRLEALAGCYSLSVLNHMWAAVAVDKGTPWLCQKGGTATVMMTFHKIQASFLGRVFFVFHV